MKLKLYFIPLLIVVFCSTIKAQKLPANLQQQVNVLLEQTKQYKQNNEQPKLAGNYNKIGLIYWNNNMFKNAADYFQKSLNINEQIGNRNAQATLNTYLGLIYSDLNKPTTAINYFQKALQLNRQIAKKDKLAFSYLYAGQTFTQLKKYDKAERNLSEAEALAQELTDFRLLKSVAGTFIELYKATSQTEKLNEYISKYSTFDTYIRNKDTEQKLKKADKLVSSVLAEKFETRQALKISKEELKAQDSLMLLKSDSLKEEQELRRKQDLELELKQSRIKQQTAELKQKKAQQLFFITGSIALLILLTSLFVLYRNKQKHNQLLLLKNEKIKNQTKILENQNLELSKLSIVAAKTDNAILIMDEKGNFEWVNESFTRIFGRTFEDLVAVTPNIIGPETPPRIVQMIHKCLHQKETVTYEFDFYVEKNVKTTVHVTLTPILNKKGKVYKIVAIDSDITKIKKANEQIARQKEVLEIQNEKITSSISYAKNIQSASLPNLTDFFEHNEGFLIYKPKDIVSGDFYWVHNLSDKQSEFNKYIITVVDSTGHGVPGAFMSLIGLQLITEIVKGRKIYKPSEIINELDKLVIKALHQKTTENQDGMDLGIALVEKQENGKTRMIYAGAKRPLYIYKAGDKELITIRGSRRSVGGIKKTVTDVEIKNTAVELDKNDCIYLTTDGMVDQPNAKRTRFGSGMLTNLLSQIGSLSMTQQKKNLIKTCMAHRKDTPQRDDITLLGIKF